MGMRFRKSIKLGKYAKINLNKNSVGFTVGTKGVHYTVNSKEKTTTTVGIPGTGLSYSTTNNVKNKQNHEIEASETPEPATRKKINPIVYFLITVFTGYLGIHKFIVGKTGIGIIYLFTLGLFGFGWIADCILSFISIFKPDTIEEVPDESSSPSSTQQRQDMSKVSFGGYKSPGGGYCNYAEFMLQGINPKTNRKNTFKTAAKDERDAKERAKAEKGLVEPFEISVIPFNPPTERQLEYAQNVGFDIPSDANIEDISAMLTRYQDQDEPATQDLADYADGIGVFFSAYIGCEKLLGAIFHHSDRDCCALYAYAVAQSIKKAPIANMLTDARRNLYYSFADYAVNNEKILQSIKDRPLYDLQNPHKGTIAYKEAFQYITK